MPVRVLYPLVLLQPAGALDTPLQDAPVVVLKPDVLLQPDGID
jgi:hypothetical protein